MTTNLEALAAVLGEIEDLLKGDGFHRSVHICVLREWAAALRTHQPAEPAEPVEQREADRDIAAGRVESFDSMTALLDSLQAEQAGGKDAIKERLTEADEPGVYEVDCRRFSGKALVVWEDEHLFFVGEFGAKWRVQQGEYTNFRRLVPAAATAELQSRLDGHAGTIDRTFALIKKYAVETAPEYPKIVDCEPSEQLYAIIQTLLGVSSANEDLRKVIAELQAKNQRLTQSLARIQIIAENDRDPDPSENSDTVAERTVLALRSSFRMESKARDYWKQRAMNGESQLAAKGEVVEQLKGVLRSLEWSADHGSDDICPACRHAQEGGTHALHCELAKAIVSSLSPSRPSGEEVGKSPAE